MLSPVLVSLAERCIADAKRAGTKLVTAESCTGGLVAACLTHIAGSSDAFERGFVTYSNEAKAESLGVSRTLIASRGAVSHEVAKALARGALAHARADIAVSITGIAGPTGDTAGKPIGLVYVATARRDGTIRSIEHRFGDIGREGVREKSAAKALEMMIDEIADSRSNG